MDRKLAARVISIGIGCLVCSLPAIGQETDTGTQMGLSLSDLLNLPVTVASKKALTSRDSPGIVSIITDEEIRNMGARDLIDILLSVPGISSLGVDVEGVTDFGMRGIWAHEGKALLLIDGHEMNEPLFSTLQLGHHYPVDQIKRIEIIRGPGSAIYGGNAELSVINIITKNAEDLSGVQVNGKYGQMVGTVGRQDLSLQAGKKIGDLNIKAAGYLGTGTRSNRDYMDVYGTSYSMIGNSNLNPQFLNLGVEFKGLDVSLIYDHYSTSYRDGGSKSLPNAIGMKFDSLLATAKYDWKVSQSLTITPLLSYDHYQPWSSPGEDAKAVAESSTDFQDFYFNRQVDRLRAQVNASYDLTDKVNLLGGVEKNIFLGKDYLQTFAFTGTDQLTFNSVAVYSQLLWNSDLALLTAGARFESHSQFGTAFVPRFAVTKVIDRFHMKALASQAYRAPSIENLDLNPTISPERTSVYELETGYQLSDEWFITANLFDTTIKDPIIYYYDTGDAYRNYEQTGSRGAEVETRWVSRQGYLALNYSYYTTAGKNRVDAYSVPGHDELVLALPQHKVAMNGHYRLIDNLYLNPSLVYQGVRYGYEATTPPDDVNGTPELKAFSPTWLVNVYFDYKDFLVRNLNLGLGVYNILDQDFRFIQPYYDPNSDLPHAPLPGLPREVVVNLSYHTTF